MATALTDLARLARREGDLETARRHCAEVLALGELRLGARRGPPARGARRRSPRSIAQPRRALALFAAAAALRIRLGWPVPASERAGNQRLIEEQKQALGSGAAQAWSEGWRMDTSEALRFARPVP